MRRILQSVFIAFALALFCAALTSPIFYVVPLNCPQGSRVIGIECFDAQYKNTTPWYRQDMGASIASFPFWLVLSLAVVAAASRIRVTEASSSTDYRPSITVHPETDLLPTVAQAPSKDWLPTNCPHCGGALSSKNVEWISPTEAKCPYCGGTVKATGPV